MVACASRFAARRSLRESAATTPFCVRKGAVMTKAILPEERGRSANLPLSLITLPSRRSVRTAWGRFQDACCEAREEGARCAPGRPARDLRARWWGDPLGPIELVYPTTISSRAQVRESTRPRCHLTTPNATSGRPSGPIRRPGLCHRTRPNRANQPVLSDLHAAVPSTTLPERRDQFTMRLPLRTFRGTQAALE